MTRRPTKDDTDIAYAELHVRSAFSMLDGASLPETLAARAAELGLRAIALTDLHDLGGAVRFAQACGEQAIHAIFGAELTIDGGASIVLLCEDEAGWRNLATLITHARMDRPRGHPSVDLARLAAHSAGLVALDGGQPRSAALGDGGQRLQWAGMLAEIFDRRLYLEVHDHALAEDVAHTRDQLALARKLALPWVVTADARHATASDKLVHDTLRCIQHHTTLEEAGDLLFPNDARRLRSPREIARAWREAPEGVWRTIEVAERCRFALSSLRPRLPNFVLPLGVDDADAYLAARVEEGARNRYGARATDRHRAQLAHELTIIRDLGLAGYFLIVWDIARYARAENILAQGRGSAANSAVCYCLYITAVDPIGGDLLFERFLSAGRDEAPDIDIDIAHQDRERVIAYVYERYGREHAAMVCTIVSWRAKSAVRDAARVLGFPTEIGDRLAREVGPAVAHDGGPHEAHHGARDLSHGGLVRAGLDPNDGRTRALVRVVRALSGLPRHRSIHNGGFVLTGERLSGIVPIEPAGMSGRTVIQWEKDDLDPTGLVKIDLLGLGMLTLLADALRSVRDNRGETIDLGALPVDDPATYAMIRRADTVGVFQIESRAQMNTLPRTRPERFYDLVVQVALIRPGPIQGEMVHPYIRRRRGEEDVSYLHPSLQPLLERTLGVPLFQEQGMKLAVVAAGFTPTQADELRRAMSSRRSGARMARLSLALMEGMAERGIEPEVGRRIVKQLTAFASYGFPESHAASFALLVYASAWLKHHRTPEFYAALLNAQPMGFYPVGSIVADAQRHGVEVRRPDARHSAWACTLEPSTNGPHPFAVRFGISLVSGIGDAVRNAIARGQRAARDGEGSDALAAFVSAADLPDAVLRVLARAGAFDGWARDRRHALWEVLRLRREGAGPLDLAPPPGAPPELPMITEGEIVLDDYASFGASIRHPMTLLRERLADAGIARTDELEAMDAPRPIRIAGLVSSRQAPMTAKGFVFLSLEDEAGIVNIVVSPQLAERQRRELTTHPLLLVEGELQRHQGAVCVKASRLVPIRGLTAALPTKSHDFR